MAFGNATKGYVKAHAGGGGGTSDYEQLLNKPSINGVELLGDKSIGSLSGNIQVKLSDIANTNLSNVQNAQTLLYNALSQKWENKASPTQIEKATLYTGSEKVNSITLSSSYTNYDFLVVQFCATVSETNYLNSVIVNVNDVVTGNNIGVSDDSNYCWYSVTSNTTLSAEGSQGSYFIKSITGIKLFN